MAGRDSPRCGWRWALLPVLAWALALALSLAALPGLGIGAPVRTLVVGGPADGSLQFARHLAQLWEARQRPTPERLAVRVVESPVARLRALRPGRDDFAILPVDMAAERIGETPGAAAVGILWPVLLHALTREPGVQALRLPLTLPVRVARGGAYAYPLLRELGGEPGADGARLTLATVANTAELERVPPGGVLLFPAPAPAQEIVEVLEADGSLHLALYDPQLLEELRLRRPWLQTASIPAGGYPRLRMPLEAPARYLVLVAGPEVSADAVRKMLATVWGTRQAAARVYPLFGQIDPERNRLFAPLLPFHPVSAQAFGLEPQPSAPDDPGRSR